MTMSVQRIIERVGADGHGADFEIGEFIAELSGPSPSGGGDDMVFFSLVSDTGEPVQLGAVPAIQAPAFRRRVAAHLMAVFWTGKEN